MIGVVTVVFGQIVRVIRLVLRVSWCESQNASLQALFVCLYLDGGNVVSVHAALLRRRRKLWTFGRKSCLSEWLTNFVSKRVSLHDLPDKFRQSIWESNSLQITKPTLTSPTSPVQSMGCSNVNDGYHLMVSRCLTPAWLKHCHGS